MSHDKAICWSLTAPFLESTYVGYVCSPSHRQDSSSWISVHNDLDLWFVVHVSAIIFGRVDRGIAWDIKKGIVRAISQTQPLGPVHMHVYRTYMCLNLAYILWGACHHNTNLIKQGIYAFWLTKSSSIPKAFCLNRPQNVGSHWTSGTPTGGSERPRALTPWAGFFDRFHGAARWFNHRSCGVSGEQFRVENRTPAEAFC